MQYDNLIKKILEGTFYDENKYDPFRGRTADLEVGQEEKKSSFEYVPREMIEYDASEIEGFWEEYRNIIGRAVFNSPEELQKFTELTEKVLVVPLKPKYAIAFPPEIALQIMQSGEQYAKDRIHDNYKFYSKLGSLAGMDRASYGPNGVIGLTPFTEVKNLSLPSESGNTTEANYLFDNWLSWLHDKREEGWIIAGTDISFESEK